jgi:hypothetical protein
MCKTGSIYIYKIESKNVNNVDQTGYRCRYIYINNNSKKSKGIPRQAEVAIGVPGRLRSRIISTFSTTRVVGHQPYAPAAFTPGEIPGTHFQEAESTSGHMVLS